MDVRRRSALSHKAVCKAPRILLDDDTVSDICGHHTSGSSHRHLRSGRQKASRVGSSAHFCRTDTTWSSRMDIWDNFLRLRDNCAPFEDDRSLSDAHMRTDTVVALCRKVVEVAIQCVRSCN